MNRTQRKVTHRDQVSASGRSGSGYTRSQKAKLRSRERMQKIALTQAKRYLIYALASFLLAQLVKFLTYSVLFRGDYTPGGFWFLLVIYLQTGLLILTFVFFVLAVFKTLQRLLTEEI